MSSKRKPRRKRKRSNSSVQNKPPNLPSKSPSPSADELAKVESRLIQQSTETQFAGPLPSPESFERYDQVLPGAAERILALAEKEQQIRADLQAGLLANDRRRITGAVSLGILLIGVAGLATWMGNEVIALSFGLTGTIASFVRGIIDWRERRRNIDAGRSAPAPKPEE